eukprot:3664719-Pleurochrysis_carterae.AAC.3
MDMNGEDARIIHGAREFTTERVETFAEYMKEDETAGTQQSWDYTWREFLRYAQRGDRVETAKENVAMNEETANSRTKEPYPTLGSELSRAGDPSDGHGRTGVGHPLQDRA